MTLLATVTPDPAAAPTATLPLALLPSAAKTPFPADPPPTAVLEKPVVFSVSASTPTAVLRDPSPSIGPPTLEKSANAPTAVLPAPLLLEKSAAPPAAVLPRPVVF